PSVHIGVRRALSVGRVNRVIAGRTIPRRRPWGGVRDARVAPGSAMRTWLSHLLGGGGAGFAPTRRRAGHQVVPIGYFAKIASACLNAFSAAASGVVPFWMMSAHATGQTWVLWISA